MRITKWNEREHGALTEAAARGRYHPALYEVLVRRVDEAVRLTGEAPRRMLIGLEGFWFLEAEGRRAVIQPGDVVEIASGEFVFEAAGPVLYLAVYPLPPDKVVN